MSSVVAPTGTSLLERLYIIAKTSPDAEALVSPELKLNYSQLIFHIETQAKLLADEGVHSEAIVGIKCADDIQHIILLLAAHYLGATTFTVPTYEPEAIQQQIAQRCNAQMILEKHHALAITTSHQYSTSINNTLVNKHSRFLFSSSGTTGEPKLIIHHDSDIVAQAHRHIDDELTRFACLASIEHNFAKRHRLYCLAQGATNLFLDAQSDEFVSQCKRLNLNVLHVSVFQAQQLLAISNISALSSIRLKLGGSHASTTLRQQLRDNITPNLQAGYGTTETGAICFTDIHDQASNDSVGRALPGIEITILSKDKKPLSQGETGEIAIRCKGMFRGYLNQPELSRTALKNAWFHTGDVGFLDTQQRLHLRGRADDMFVFNSINIFPQDIETSLRQHAAVADAAVIAKTSNVHGDIPVALITLNPETEQSAVLKNVKQYAASQLGLRCPQKFSVVDKIPRNAAGKISRIEAQQLFNKASDIRAALIENLHNSKSISHIKQNLIETFLSGEGDIRLKHIGLDSLAQMTLLVMIEVTYDKVILPKELESLTSLNNIISIILSDAEEASVADSSITTQDIKDTNTFDATKPPKLIVFFRRVFRFCKTAVQLNRALVSFEYRLTPKEFICLYEWHQHHALIPANTEDKLQIALNNWLHTLYKQMRHPTQEATKAFTRKRINPLLTHFIGTDSNAEKTLVIGFSMARARHLSIPNCVLLQYTDARRYDVLIVGAPKKAGYDEGLPLLGDDEQTIIQNLSALDILKNYNRIRTIGSSAGAPIAVLLAGHLNAEVAVSLGGRFHKNRYPLKILSRFRQMRKNLLKLKQATVIFCYGNDRRRDKAFANIMTLLFTGSKFAIDADNRRFSHTILDDLLKLERLSDFLSCTLYTETPAPKITDNKLWHLAIKHPS